MKKAIPLLVLLALLLGIWLAEVSAADPEETVPAAAPPETLTESVPAKVTEPAKEPVSTDTIPAEEPTQPVLELTEEEQTMLLKIGMAELGKEECTECIALVMRTVLNRVDTGEFGDTVDGVLRAKGQFTPLSDGTYYRAVPNESCYEALDWVIHGWDESEGALYYEFCTGESWHSRNLELLVEHCNARFYK